MSGGSYNYLHSRDVVDGGVLEDLRAAHERLTGLGYATDVAANVAGILRAAEDLEHRKEAINEVLRALEWWDSNDYSENQFREALDDFRTQQTGEEEQ